MATNIFTNYDRFGNRNLFTIGQPLIRNSLQSVQTQLSAPEDTKARNSEIVDDDETKPEPSSTNTRIFAQNTAPEGGYVESALWFDTSNSNKIYRANGALQWVSVQDGSIFSGNWSDVVDDGGKPDDNATVGAIAGTNFTGAGTDNNDVSDTGVVTRFLRQVFGDGTDGDATISSNTTLTSDVYYNDLTINSSYTLNTGGYRVFVKGTLTVQSSAVIGRIGGDAGNGSNGVNGSGGGYGAGGAGGTAAAVLADGSIFGGSAGEAGGAGGTASTPPTGNGGAGTNGDDVVKGFGSAGGNGVAGGAGGDGNAGGNAGGIAGAIGTGGSLTGTVFNKPRNIISALTLRDDLPSADIIRGSGGTGSSSGAGAGGSGSGGSPQSGGGGGAGGSAGSGGTVMIFARTIANAGSITANGGTGGNGGNGGDANSAGNGGGGGGGAGGTGGSGGLLIVGYNSKSGAGTITADGGSGGTAGTGGTGYSTGDNGSNGTVGSTGTAGKLIELEI